MKSIKNRWSVLAVVACWVVAGAAVAADKVYVANEEDDSVTVLDAESFNTLATVRVGKGPHNVQVAPGGKLAWVSNNGEPGAGAAAGHGGAAGGGHGATSQAGAVWAIDTARDAVVAKVPVGPHPAHVVLSPDGRVAYVTNGGDGTLSVVDVAAQHTVATVPVGNYPHGARFSPDGRQAYVANLKSGTVSVIDTADHKEVATIAAGKGPAQVGFTPDGRHAFVSLSEENAVAVIDPVTRKVTRKIGVGTVPIQLYATPDSRTLLVANQGTRKKPGSTVSVIDLATFEVVKTIETGAGAHGVVVDRDGRRAYVSNIYANTVSVIDLAQLKVVHTARVGKGPNGISVTP